MGNPFARFAKQEDDNPFGRFKQPAKKPSMGEDFMRPVRGAWDKLKADTKADYDRAGRLASGKERPAASDMLDMGPGPRLIGNALKVAASPFVGAVDAVVSRPAARAAIGAGLPVYERQNALTIPTAPPRRVYGEEAEATVAGDINLALSGARTPNALRAAPPPRPAPTPVQVAGARARLDPVAMRARAAEMRSAGVEPTLTDVSGDRGRRMIRAVGVRGEEAGEVLAGRAAEASAVTKPAVMAKARSMGPRVGETADEVKASLEQARDTAAEAAYRPAYAEPVSVTSETLRALSGPTGKAALRQARKAAEARLDEAQMAEIDALLGAADGAPPTQVSAGTLDRVRIALREMGSRASKNDQGAYASGVRGRMDTVDETLASVPGLEPARADFRAKTQAIEVLDNKRPDIFSTDPADYRRWFDELPPEAQEANQLAIRQEIIDTLGGQRSSSFGSLDQLATSPYARENLRAAFGAEDADEFLAGVSARLAQTRNASMVSPNAGSRTAVLENDAGNAAQQAVGAVRQGLSGDLLGLAARAVDAWRRRGFTPEQAEELARIASDPTQTDAAIEAIAAQLAGPVRAEFMGLRRAARALPAVARPAAAATGASQLSSPEYQTNALTGR